MLTQGRKRGSGEESKEEAGSKGGYMAAKFREKGEGLQSKAQVFRGSILEDESQELIDNTGLLGTAKTFAKPPLQPKQPNFTKTKYLRGSTKLEESIMPAALSKSRRTMAATKARTSVYQGNQWDRIRGTDEYWILYHFFRIMSFIIDYVGGVRVWRENQPYSQFLRKFASIYNFLQLIIWSTIAFYGVKYAITERFF